MRVTQRDGTAERQVMIGCIVSKKVLGAVAQKWKDHGLFSSRHANLVVQWCVTHYRKYNTAPKSAVQQYFHEWADTNKDAELVGAVGSLLSGLSAETERLKQQLTPDHLLDIAGVYFESVRLKDLVAQVGACLERNDVEQARSLVEKSRKIELGLGSGIDLFTDRASLERAFESRLETVIDLPGAMGNFYENALFRGAFVAVLGEEKSGKSFDIQDLACRAVEQGKRVAYFEMGDDTQEEVILRFASRMTGRPYDPQWKKTDKIEIPVKLESNDEALPILETNWVREPCVTLDYAWEVWQKYTGSELMKLWAFPSGSLSVTAADALLDEKAREGWNADVVVFDYLDLAAPIDRQEKKLEQENLTWLTARGISQKRHALVLTATQANRLNPGARIKGREDIGGSHLKLAHVTGMTAINQTPKEKQMGLSRRNWVGGRKLKFGTKKCVWFAGCLAIGQPCILSSF